jgi:hypothetical protein
MPSASPKQFGGGSDEKKTAIRVAICKRMQDKFKRQLKIEAGGNTDTLIGSEVDSFLSKEKIDASGLKELETSIH